MVALAGSSNKPEMEFKLPILSGETVPKKDAVTPKVLAIKLPLDIDISIHREHHRGFKLSLIALAFLFVLPYLFMYSFHRQMLLYEYELAGLRMQVSGINIISSTLSVSSQEIQNTISQVQSIVKNCDCNSAKAKRVHRRKRNTDEGLNVAVTSCNEQYQNGASNDTMRGQIGPWYEDQQAVGDFGLQSCKLRDRGVKLIVNETGLYLIYAQVYYLTSKTLNSYSINVNPGNKATSIPVAFCSANASINDQGASEVSCYTSVVRRLQAGDAISLQQQERQRRLVMRDGHSFVGLVRLS